MKKLQLFAGIICLSTTVLATSCQADAGRTSLSAKDFQSKITELPNEVILDVRTAEEYAEGHLAQSKNIDWNGNDFEKQVAALPKDQPIMVYCLSGGRSAEAAEKLHTMGFANIYEMKGGMMKWKADNLPMETAVHSGVEAANAAKEMTADEYNQLIKSKGQVLVDFYADWCKPCKQMEPMLKQLGEEQKDKLAVVRINADDNETVSQMMGVDALPYLLLYNQGKLVWQKKGLTEKEEILKQMK